MSKKAIIASPSSIVAPKARQVKIDDLSAEHLGWLVQSRTRNQTACLSLYTLFERHPGLVKNTEFRAASQTLVSIGFSLWRAAFLADKTGSREAVFEDAKSFLARILTDNAINYPKDCSSREWTFNYYMTNANNGLLRLCDKWPEVNATLSKHEKVNKGTRNPHRRWNRHQNAFETAISSFETELTQAATNSTPSTFRKRTSNSRPPLENLKVA